MKKTVKMMSILLMSAILMMALSTTVMAGNAGALIGQLNPTYQDNGSGLTGIGQSIINIISVVAIVVAVIVLLVIGVKYMMGSASEKAEYKKTMIPYLVGAILVFGAGAIAQVVVNLASSIRPMGY